MQRFITKRTKRRLVRPFRNSNLINKVQVQQKQTEEEKIVEKVKKNIKNGKKASKKQAKEENNTENDTDMNTEPNNVVDKIKEVVENDPNFPKRNVKIEKREKGLYERTEDSTILITEDNKLMLTD